MSAAFRVSAKQRLELIKQAFAEFMDQSKTTLGVEVDHYQAFVDKVEEAMTGKLDPKNKPAEPAE